eukprot:m51a1_g7448 hypothetical protein (281) ;mRNA; f:101215-102149
MEPTAHPALPLLLALALATLSALPALASDEPPKLPVPLQARLSLVARAGGVAVVNATSSHALARRRGRVDTRVDVARAYTRCATVVALEDGDVTYAVTWDDATMRGGACNASKGRAEDHVEAMRGEALWELCHWTLAAGVTWRGVAADVYSTTACDGGGRVTSDASVVAASVIYAAGTARLLGGNGTISVKGVSLPFGVEVLLWDEREPADSVFDVPKPCATAAKKFNYTVVAIACFCCAGVLITGGIFAVAYWVNWRSTKRSTGYKPVNLDTGITTPYL